MIFYTDGATSRNGAADATGGWAWAAIDVKNQLIAEDSGHIDNATNNICELTAIINACKYAVAHFPQELNVIYSDSAYCISCCKQHWYDKWQINGWINSKKQPVANKELWEELIPFFMNPWFSFQKTEGHAGVQWNEYVDKKAVEAKVK